MKPVALDLRSANVSFTYEPFGDYPDGEYYVGRDYYWYDPTGRLPSMNESVFRSQHPEIDDREWEELFYQAFDRGETAHVAKMTRQNPELYSTPQGRELLAMGRLYGPRGIGVVRTRPGTPPRAEFIPNPPSRHAVPRLAH